MNRAVFVGDEATRAWGQFSYPADVVAEMAGALFPSTLRRRDQRQRAEQYVRGLLTVEGRKSMRNIATTVGGGAAEQSLHHFIAGSTWHWESMRENLARYVQSRLEPKAWVVHPLSIPKAGGLSVGVERRFNPALGQLSGSQQAFGVWFASEEMSTPVSWRLHLPDRWTQDGALRRRAEIPESATPETLEECASAAVLRSVSDWRVPRRPVVLGATGPDVRATVLRYRAREIPVLARISGTTGLVVADTAMPGFGAGRLTAQQILDSVRGLRRPVSWADPDSGPGAVRDSLVAAARVEFPDAAPRRRAGPGSAPRADMLVIGEWTDPARPPAEFWLTEMTCTPVPVLLRLAKLSRRVAVDCAGAGEQVGLRDFEGRSFRGWHRHITLASVALTARALTDPGRLAGDSGPADRGRPADSGAGRRDAYFYPVTLPA